jgi:hypothetical protein
VSRFGVGFGGVFGKVFSLSLLLKGFNSDVMDLFDFCLERFLMGLVGEVGRLAFLIGDLFMFWGVYVNYINIDLYM